MQLRIILNWSKKVNDFKELADHEIVICINKKRWYSESSREKYMKYLVLGWFVMVIFVIGSSLLSTSSL